MAKIIIFGDIDISSLYISVDGCKEITISGKYPRSITVSAGKHRVEATTVSKTQRALSGVSSGGFLDAFSDAMMENTNTSLAGTLDFGSDDALLIQVNQKGMKTEVYNKMIPLSEANDYVEMSAVLEYNEKPPKRGLFGCLFG